MGRRTLVRSAIPFNLTISVPFNPAMFLLAEDVLGTSLQLSLSSVRITNILSRMKKSLNNLDKVSLISESSTFLNVNFST